MRLLLSFGSWTKFNSDSTQIVWTKFLIHIQNISLAVVPFEPGVIEFSLYYLSQVQNSPKTDFFLLTQAIYLHNGPWSSSIGLILWRFDCQFICFFLLVISLISFIQLYSKFAVLCIISCLIGTSYFIHFDSKIYWLRDPLQCRRGPPPGNVKATVPPPDPLTAPSPP